MRTTMKNEVYKSASMTAPITVNIDEIVAMKSWNDTNRIEFINNFLEPYFELAKAKLNILICGHKAKFNKVKSINISGEVGSNFQFDTGYPSFTCDIAIDGCNYFCLTYDHNDNKGHWFLHAVESDMGDRDTPPSTDLVELVCTNDFIQVVDMLVDSYKMQIDRWIGDEMEADRYEHDRYEQIRDLEERNGQAYLPEDIW